jgi:HEAT repeat protein
VPLLEILSVKSYYSKRQGASSAARTEQIHRHALAAFQALGSAAVPPLTNFLAGDTATSAAQALSQIHPEGLIVLVQVLTNSDAALRQKVELGIETSGPDNRALVPVLLANLKHDNELVRAYAAKALGKLTLEPQTVVPSLIECLRDPNADVRVMTVQALGEYGPQATTAILPLLDTSKDKIPSVARAAFVALKKIAPDAAAKAGFK